MTDSSSRLGHPVGQRRWRRVGRDSSSYIVYRYPNDNYLKKMLNLSSNKGKMQSESSKVPLTPVKGHGVDIGCLHPVHQALCQLLLLNYLMQSPTQEISLIYILK